MATRPRIALVQPSHYLPDGRLVRSEGVPFPSLALPLLAALAPNDVDVVVRDDRFENIDFDEKVDLVGITGYTIHAIRAYEIADQFRRRKVPVVMGGMHVSMEPDEAAEHADTVIVGEADELWPRFLHDFKCGCARPRYSADGYPSLANLPVPRFSLLDPQRYILWRRRGFSRLLPTPLLPIQTARGCPHHCEFCCVTAFSGRHYRPRPVEDVVREIKTLGLKVCVFVDDNIFADPQRARALCEALLPLRITWFGQATITAGKDPELLRLARKSGCAILLIGLESLSSEHLLSVGKRQNTAVEYEEMLKAYHDAQISVIAAMLFGFDDEAPSCFREACDFLIRNRVRYTSWYPLIPYPGTPLLARMRQEGRLKDPRWWLNRQMANQHWALRFTGLPMGEEVFWREFFRAYQRFYSLGNILRRLLLPRPRQRWLPAGLVNLWLKSRLNRSMGLFESI